MYVISNICVYNVIMCLHKCILVHLAAISQTNPSRTTMLTSTLPEKIALKVQLRVLEGAKIVIISHARVAVCTGITHWEAMEQLRDMVQRHVPGNRLLSVLFEDKVRRDGLSGCLSFDVDVDVDVGLVASPSPGCV